MPPLTGLDLAELALLVTALGAAIVAWRNQKAGEATTLLAEYGKRLAMLDTKVCELEKKVMRLQDDNEKLRERVVQLELMIADLRDENDELKVGITILIEQLRVLGAAPEWRPRPRKTEVKSSGP